VGFTLGFGSLVFGSWRFWWADGVAAAAKGCGSLKKK
jgi:hypothetical protein